MSADLSLSTSIRVEGLESFFGPSGIALVGASESSQKLGYAMKMALEGDHGIPIACINPSNENMFSDIDSAQQRYQGELDLAVFCIPAALTADALRDAARVGIKAALICAGGFAEAGGEGTQYQQDIEEVICDTGIRVLGPNTSGYFVPAMSLEASFVPGVENIKPGGVGVISSSGGVNHSLSFRLNNAGFGVSAGIGIGAGTDVGAPELVQYLAQDTNTTAIALHLESVRDGSALMEAVQIASKIKPVVAFIVGKNDVNDFAQSHTGALATSWRATRAALSQAGAVCVDDESELVDVAGVLSHQRLSPRPTTGIGLITAQAGPGLIAADTLGEAHHLTLPELTEQTQQKLSKLLPPLTYQKNPVDSGRPTDTFPEVVRSVAEDPKIDLVGVYGLLEPVVDLSTAVVQGSQGTVPAVIGSDGLQDDIEQLVTQAHENHLPVVSGPTTLATVMHGMARDARAQHLLDQACISTASAPVANKPYDEYAVKQLLQLLGISIPKSYQVSSKHEATEVFAHLKTPVAVKLLDANILHKTEVGGVHLNINASSQLVAAIDTLATAGHTSFLIEEMAPSGIDLIAGAHRDPMFGPLVLFGFGGVNAEATQDVAVQIAPLRYQSGSTMVNELAAKDVLFNWRGGPTLDLIKAEETLATLGNLLIENPAVESIEINPLRLTAHGLVALDAVLTQKTF